MTNDEYNVMLIDSLMKRVTALEAGQVHMMDKLNRAEANTAHAKPVETGDPLFTAINDAIAAFERAIVALDPGPANSALNVNSVKRSFLERVGAALNGR